MILSGLIDKREDLIADLTDTEFRCQSMRTWYVTTIRDLNSQLKMEQTNLGVAMKHLVINTQFSITYNINYRTLSGEFHTTMNQCCVNQNAVTSEICALNKIRGELYKIWGLTVFITDCEVSEWTADECSVSCGGGVQTLRRVVIIHPVNGTGCPPLGEERSCSMQGCPTDCELSEWENWGKCSADCDGGVRSRARSKTVDQVNGGDPCTELSETETCNTGACDIPCVLKDWTEWGICSRMCGGGSETRTRDIFVEAKGQGTCASAMSDHRRNYRDCNTVDCPPRFLCGSMIDVVIVLDGSSSLGEDGWSHSKNMVKNFANIMIGNESGINLAVLLFSGPEDEVGFDNCNGENAEAAPTPEQCNLQWITRFTDKMSDVVDGVDKMVWPAGATFTSLALAETESLLTESRQGANAVVIVVTDGKPMSPRKTRQASTMLKEKARLIWVPVGDGLTEESINDMRSWASPPASDNVLPIATFSVMDSIPKINELTSMFCTQLEAINTTQSEDLLGGWYPEKP